MNIWQIDGKIQCFWFNLQIFTAGKLLALALIIIAGLIILIQGANTNI